MKKTTSFHLEEDILNEIEEYKKEHNLSSRNIALERMLLERRFLVRMPIAAQSVAQIEAAPVKLEKNEENIYWIKCRKFFQHYARLDKLFFHKLIIKNIAIRNISIYKFIN